LNYDNVPHDENCHVHGNNVRHGYKCDGYLGNELVLKKIKKPLPKKQLREGIV
jgi:hypothetical protein